MHDLSSFEPALHPRRYLSWTDVAKARYGARVQKVSVAAGFTCPNRDGSKGIGGCTFCNNMGFTPGYVRESPDNINMQINTGMEFLQRRYPNAQRWVAYFQAYSNTYGELSTLINAYQTALSRPEIDGLVIGTRPDCVSDDLLDYLADLSRTHLVELELGIESTDDATLARVNRGHDFASSVDAIKRAAARGLTVAGHVLLGLPGESRDSMLAGATKLSALPLSSLKLHQLQVVKGTQLANDWRRDPSSVPMLSLEDYLELLADFIERLRPDLALQRVGSEVPPSMRLAPDWSVRLSELAPLLTAKLTARNSWQGRLWQPSDC
ncbi:TIGR01212 family radical SAM protein [Chitinibacter bivalviorum]|uniref:TIGR01212 family radical SAM protein n=1 Tax=Chitinibacter bivalviorum TaxID=2739434 RepID=A0A7H9BNC6_9NEIS|nr:TIGR01212 family radical SAM protein [Chitinibacter bivalviorum]QLG89531.1 TIGR01212 family radical SAM protein [Chitinibacter bivalviorum]